MAIQTIPKPDLMFAVQRNKCEKHISKLYIHFRPPFELCFGNALAGEVGGDDDGGGDDDEKSEVRGRRKNSLNLVVVLL